LASIAFSTLRLRLSDVNGAGANAGAFFVEAIMTKTETIDINGDALIRAKRASRKKFDELVKHYHARGAADQQIVEAVLRSRLLIDNVGKR
jgi:hypothetical protein